MNIITPSILQTIWQIVVQIVLPVGNAGIAVSAWQFALKVPLRELKQTTKDLNTYQTLSFVLAVVFVKVLAPAEYGI